jgi:glyoxylase I family protein
MSWGDVGGTTIWAPFPADTDYFGSANQWMVNCRVDDLDGLLAKLRDEGSTSKREPWKTRTSEGNRVELGSRHLAGRRKAKACLGWR